MISVTVAINGRTIFHRSAVNKSDTYGEGVQTYELDDHKIIKHEYEDGALKLAIKMLEGIKET